MRRRRQIDPLGRRAALALGAARTGLGVGALFADPADAEGAAVRRDRRGGPGLGEARRRPRPRPRRDDPRRSRRRRHPAGTRPRRGRPRRSRCRLARAGGPRSRRPARRPRRGRLGWRRRGRRHLGLAPASARRLATAVRAEARGLRIELVRLDHAVDQAVLDRLRGLEEFVAFHVVRGSAPSTGRCA